MTQTLEHAQAGSSGPAPGDAPRISTGSMSGGASSMGGGRSKRKLGVPIALQIGAMIGIGALLYSSAADWFSTLNHNSEISGYVDAVEQLPDAAREEALDLAREYNSHMPAGMLRDPYSNPISEEEVDAGYLAYEALLRVSDNGVIGQLSYPRLAMSLPVYHGTGETAISSGAGHLYGSSLPIGGPSTHSILTSHSGLLNASLFTRLPEARIGDTFAVTVLGETHYYQVDGIETVLPEATEGLQIVQGEDRITLITCTPTGINSHRLLVHASRTVAPAAEDGSRVIAGDGITAGFPWWAIGFVGGSALTAYLLFVPPRRRRTTNISTSSTSSTSSMSEAADRKNGEVQK